MKKNILLLSCICSIVATQNISAKNDSTIKELELITKETSLENQIIQKAEKSAFQAENKNITIEELKQKLYTLSTQLNKIMAKVENENDKQILIQVVQTLQNEQSNKEARPNSAEINSSPTKPEISNNKTLRRDLFDVIKNLTSPWAFVAYAVIICSFLTKGILDSGQIVVILDSLKTVLERFVTLGKIVVIGPIVLYIIQTISYYASFGYSDKSF